MRVLVTGGAGFIGSNLVDGLLAEGAEVSVFDDLSTGRRVNLDAALDAGAVLHEGDLRDPGAVADAMTAARPEVVFHLAAQIDVRRSVTHPDLDARINVEGTARLLEAARTAGVRRVVFSSTGGAIYGEAETIPTPEDAPALPLAPYGQAKLAGEGYCHLYARLHGLSTMCLRYGNVYGPRQDPLGEAGVVALFCAARAQGRRPTVFGDGTQTRDYVYVGDVVAANLAAMGSGAVGSLNVGTGRETSVLDLVDALAPLGPPADFTPEFEPPRAGEVHRSCLDASRATEVLGWSPRTGIDEGLRLTQAALGDLPTG